VKVKAPAEKNFRRAKVRPGRAKRSRARSRAGWRVGRHLAALLLLCFAAYRGVNLVVRAAPLQVGRIVVTGNERLSDAEVEALARGLYGRSILTADLAAGRRHLLESPWVADASLRRVLPSTIEVRVVERQPIGISRVGNQLYLIDRSGSVIDEFGPRYREFDLPIVDGLVRSPKKGKPAIDEQRAELAARVLDSVSTRKAIAKRLSQIDVGNPHDVVVLLDGDPALLHLGEERFVERLQSYVEVASALRGRVAEIDYVDLRFDDRVYVKPRGATGTIEAGKPPTPRTTF
jgi:cell division septal protein FtsQ